MYGWDRGCCEAILDLVAGTGDEAADKQPEDLQGGLVDGGFGSSVELGQAVEIKMILWELFSVVRIRLSSTCCNVSS